MKKCPKPKPPLPEPDPALAERIFKLEELWTDACRTAFQVGYWRSLFKTKAPWRDSEAKQQRRWKAFCRVVVQLDTHQIDPKEYIAALITFYKDRKASGQTQLVNPNIGQCAGPWALKIWQEWRKKRLAEGYESENRVRGAALLATQHPEEALKAEIRQAYRECISQGPDMAPGPDWSIELLWLFHQTEPATRPFIVEVFRQERAETPERYAAGVKKWQLLKGDTQRQRWLLRLKQEAIFGLPSLPTADEWFSAHAPQAPQNSILGKRGQA